MNTTSEFSPIQEYSQNGKTIRRLPDGNWQEKVSAGRAGCWLHEWVPLLGERAAAAETAFAAAY